MYLLNLLTSIALCLTTYSSGAIAPGFYDQTSTDQSNILRYIAGPNPFIEHTGYGISLDTPEFCKIDQVHLHMRHGERYPTKNAGKIYKKLFKKLKKAAKNIEIYEGPLQFVKDLEYFIDNDDESIDLDQETYKGAYSGYLETFTFASQMRQRYNDLVNTSNITPIFTSSKERVVETAKTFGKAFFGFDNYDKNVSIQIISESEDQGLNTLTPADTCPQFDSDFGNDYISKFPSIYFEREAERLNNLSPGFNITSDDIPTMIAYCGYELNAKGYSNFCNALSMDSFVANSYYNDLIKYYNQGPGNNLSSIVGSVGTNATLTLLKQGSENYFINNNSSFNGKLFLNFFHDNDLLNYLTALEFFDDYPLPNDQIEFQRTFKLGEIVPMDARLITERLICNETVFDGEEDEVYIRIILNDKVIPLSGCSSGPGYSCSLSDYSNIVENNLNNTLFIEACGINSTVPQYTKFYWDWEITTDDN